MKSRKNLLRIGVIAILTMAIVQNPLSNLYISKLKNDAQFAHAENDKLMQTIKEKAEKLHKPPSDAKIDKVWKAMPGYNGVKVDIEASYQKMKKHKTFDKRKLVFKQIRPKVHLRDLPPSPIYRGHTDKPMVSFLINVAWGNEYIPEILSILKKHDVHATFFLEGRWVKENPDLAKVIADGGHELGNHSYSHPDMNKISAVRIREELIKTNKVIEATTGEKVTLFAPPSGSFREETVEIAHSLKLLTIMWTVDTIDWRNPRPEQLITRVTSKLHPGAMILMHPTDSTTKSLERLIEHIKEQQLRIGTVSKLMDEERIIQNETDNSSSQ